MAYKVTSTTATDWSNANSWDTGTNTPSIHATTNIVLNPSSTIYSATFTAPNTTNAFTGLIFYETNISTSALSTLTFALQEYNGATWSNVATKTITVRDIYNSMYALSNYFYRISFASPYVFTTTSAGYYRIAISKDSTAGTISFASDSGGSNFAYLATDNRTGAPASTDFVYVTGNNNSAQTLSADTDSTISPTSPTPQTAYTYNSVPRTWADVLNICALGNLSMKDATSVSLTVGGNIVVYPNSTFGNGDFVNSASAGTNHNIILDCGTTNSKYGILVKQGDTLTNAAYMKFRGTPIASGFYKSNYVSGVGTVASPLVLADAVDWTVGDTIVVGAIPTDKTITCTNIGARVVKKYIKTKIDAYTYTLSDTVGGAESGLASWSSGSYHTDTLIFNFTRNINFKVVNPTYSAYMYIINYKAQVDALFNWVGFDGLTIINYGSYGSTADYLAFINNRYTGFGWGQVSNTVRMSFSNLISYSPTYAMGLLSLNYCFRQDYTDCYSLASLPGGTGGYGFAIYATDCTFTRMYALGLGCGILFTAMNYMNTYTDCEVHACNYGLQTSINVANTFIRPKFGSKGLNYKNFYPSGYSLSTILNGTYGGDFSSMYLDNIMYDGNQYLAIAPVTTDNYTTYKKYGYFITSSGAMDMVISNTSNELFTDYIMGTQNISGFKFLIGANMKINNAGYYGGSVYTLPYIQVNYDLGTLATAVSASASTATQTLNSIFTPTTNGSQISLKIAGKTDAGTTNGKLTWNYLYMNVRKYGYTFYHDQYNTIRTLLTPCMSVSTPSANPFITEANSATVSGYSEFTIDHSTQTVTITADTTLKRLYDYSQYDLTLDANMPYSEWFTTIDGVNYTSAYNIVLNTGVDLTGGGTVDVGALTFTKTGTATYDGIIIHSADREVHIKLNDIISGSTVQIYDTDNTTEIEKDVYTSDVDYIYTWTTDTNIRVRIRKAGYIPYEATGTITETGFSLNVAQEIDDVYVANGIDGSTVTEFSLSEGVVGIFIDDPDNKTTGQKLYNWYMYAISTTTFIDDQANLITAQTAWSYVLDDSIQMKNLDGSNPLYIEGANINNVSADGQVIDTTGGSININGYFPFNSASDVRKGLLTTGQFIALK